jgi:thiamine biosynthesis lipoprotein
MARISGTPLWALNEAGGGTLSPSLAEVVLAALYWAEQSRGAFDPTVARLLDLWNFPSGPHAPPDEASLVIARAATGWRKVSVDRKDLTVNLAGTSLDLGGIAKGYAVDRAAGALRAAGAENFVVNAGGDLCVAGTKNGKPWRIGIQDPRNPELLLKVVTPREGAFVTSGDYERFFLWEGERYHHILDPRTGRPARGCSSVTVWARYGIDADALATAAFVLGPAEGLALLERLEGVEGLIIDATGGERATSGFAAAAPEAPSSRPDAVPPAPEANR